MAVQPVAALQVRKATLAANLGALDWLSLWFLRSHAAPE